MSDRARLVVIGTVPAAVRERLDTLRGAVDLLQVEDETSARALLAADREDDDLDELDALRLRSDAARLVLREVRAVISSVHHDANNPLAIIAGNAQLLLELGHLTELPDDLMQPLQDIEEASNALVDILRRLTRLRDSL